MGLETTTDLILAADVCEFGAPFALLTIALLVASLDDRLEIPLLRNETTGHGRDTLLHCSKAFAIILHASWKL